MDGATRFWGMLCSPPLHKAGSPARLDLSAPRRRSWPRAHTARVDAAVRLYCLDILNLKDMRQIVDRQTSRMTIANARAIGGVSETPSSCRTRAVFEPAFCKTPNYAARHPPGWISSCRGELAAYSIVACAIPLCAMSHPSLFDEETRIDSEEWDWRS